MTYIGHWPLIEIMTPAQLKYWRKDHGYTQIELANNLRIDVTTVSRWERGVREIPKFLNLALNWLEFKENEAKKSDKKMADKFKENMEQGKRKAKQIRLDQSKDENEVADKIRGIFCGIEFNHSNRMDKFIEMHIALTDKEYWKALNNAWTMSDNTYRYRDILKSLFASQRPHREYLMNIRERQYIDSLPDKIIIYRAMTVDEYISKKYGISWTSKKDIAEFFHSKYQRNYDTENNPKTIITKRIEKKDVIAFFNERKEYEIIYLSNEKNNKKKGSNPLKRKPKKRKQKL